MQHKVFHPILKKKPGEFSTIDAAKRSKCDVKQAEDSMETDEIAFKPKARGLDFQMLPKSFRTFEYAVRGGILTYASEIQKDLLKNPFKYRFKKLYAVNIGNPQALGQVPFTFYRQVAACLMYPPLAWKKKIPTTDPPTINGLKIDKSEQHDEPHVFPEDVCERALTYLDKFPTLGAYSESQGVYFYREKVSQYISNRDGFECSPNSIFMTDGATPAIRNCMELLLKSRNDSILIPIPLYPLYTALISKMDSTITPYHLVEKDGWSFSTDELKKAYDEACKAQINVKALVLINPGNPTGTILSKETIQSAIRFCEQHSLVLLADEVYQHITFAEDKPFHSVRQCLLSCGSDVQLVSFYSISKCMGECGIRGGYMQFENVSSETLDIITKCQSVMLCSNTVGQAMCAMFLDPLSPEQASYAQTQRERFEFLEDLRKKAQLVTQRLNGTHGLSCQKLSGSMYAFPRIHIPHKAIEHAEKSGLAPDMLYCREFLENYGYICVPGSGFKLSNQSKKTEGVYHIRITLLLPKNEFEKLLDDLCEFQQMFTTKYT